MAREGVQCKHSTTTYGRQTTPPQTLPFIHFSHFAFAALDVYFPTTSVRFKLPINEESESIFSKIPLAQFQVLRLDNNLPALDHIYSLEDNHLLRMNVTSGEVFMRTDYQAINESVQYVLTAFPRHEDGNTAPDELLQQVAHLTLEVIPQSTADYCAELEHICFWSGAHYTIAESTSPAPFEPILIGALNSRAAKYLCPHRSVEYALKAGSTHFVLKQNRLYTRQPLDHDELNGLFARAGQLETTISCTVKLSGHEQRQFLRSYNVTLLDRNDNGPRLQERQPHFNFHLEQPYFKTVSSLPLLVLYSYSRPGADRPDSWSSGDCLVGAGLLNSRMINARGTRKAKRAALLQHYLTNYGYFF